jgi:uncharacterized membrane protein
MFCSKCGCRLNGESIFCHTCGFKIPAESPLEAPEAPVVSDGIAPEQASLFPENEPVLEPQNYTEAEAPTISAIPVIPAAPFIPETPAEAQPDKKEKADFGFGGLVFCLITIGVLSVFCGVLAILYFGGF